MEADGRLAYQVLIKHIVWIYIQMVALIQGKLATSNLAEQCAIATQSEAEALIIGVHLKQTRTIHTQEVTNGTIINSRGPVVAMQRLVVKPTRIPVIGARIYI